MRFCITTGTSTCTCVNKIGLMLVICWCFTTTAALKVNRPLLQTNIFLITVKLLRAGTSLWRKPLCSVKFPFLTSQCHNFIWESRKTSVPRKPYIYCQYFLKFSCVCNLSVPHFSWLNNFLKYRNMCSKYEVQQLSFEEY